MGVERESIATLSQLVLQVHLACSQEPSVGEGVKEPVQDHPHSWKTPKVGDLLMQQFHFPCIKGVAYY